MAFRDYLTIVLATKHNDSSIYVNSMFLKNTLKNKKDEDKEGKQENLALLLA